MKCQVEGPARRDHAKVLVENKQRLAHGVDDRLSKRASVHDVSEWLASRHEFFFFRIMLDNVRPNPRPLRCLFWSETGWRQRSGQGLEKAFACRQDSAKLVRLCQEHSTSDDAS
jgi:hypothetical protein